MTYEAFKRELYQHVLKQAKAGGRLAKLLEKGSVCEDGRLLQAIRIMNMNRRSGAEGRDSGDGVVFCLEKDIIKEDVLLVAAEGLGLTSVMYWKVRTLYESFKREGWQSVLPEIVMKLQKGQKISARTPFDKLAFAEGEEKLIVRPLNFAYNRQELENCVYWRFGEIALVLYAVIYDGEPDFMTMKINRGMLEKWNVSGTEALTNALLNTYAKMPPRLYPGTALHTSFDFTEGIFMKEEGASIQINWEDEEEGLRGYRLTTSRWLNGAIGLFYPGVKERLAELFEGDYYVGFTSIHEAVLHPVRYKILGEMKAAIQHANAVFDQREMLTNCVYRYCCARKELIEV